MAAVQCRQTLLDKTAVSTHTLEKDSNSQSSSSADTHGMADINLVISSKYPMESYEKQFGDYKQALN